VGDFDATKQANVILLLRGERFAGCDLPEDSSRSTPQAATMTTSSQNWSNVGTQATGLADDLDSALKQLLKGWEGKAADEFSTNVTKVVAFARQIAHVADTDNPAPGGDGGRHREPVRDEHVERRLQAAVHQPGERRHHVHRHVEGARTPVGDRPLVVEVVRHVELQLRGPQRLRRRQR